jgi:hypothetical protein
VRRLLSPLLLVAVLRVGDGELAAQDHVGGEAGVAVRRVVFRGFDGLVPLAMGQDREAFRVIGGCHLQALGASDQVKTWLKPQERTSASTSCWDFIVFGWLLWGMSVAQ